VGFDVWGIGDCFWGFNFLVRFLRLKLEDLGLGLAFEGLRFGLGFQAFSSFFKICI